MGADRAPMGLSPGRVAELVTEYRAHRPDVHDCHACCCGQPWQCPAKRDAWHELYAAGQAVAIYTTPRR
jgi:hypothetical protein